MRRIPLEAIPNQSFSVRLDDALYDITIKEARGIMAVTIVRDNVELVSGLRATAGTPLLPYRYQESGNFIITTENDEIPYYTQFGVTQNLIYASQEELEVLRAGT